MAKTNFTYKDGEASTLKEPPFTANTFKLLKDLPGVKKGNILVDWGLFVFRSRGKYGSRASRMYRFDYKTIRRMKDWFLFIPGKK